MSSWVDWDVNDTYGDNPTGKPGSFEFRIAYSIENEEYYTQPAVVLEVARCERLCFENETAREPTNDEQEALCDWLPRYLEARPSELHKLEARAFEYSYIDLDGEDIYD